mgnify:FL=1|uniref:glycosyltransferase family 4 protein n=1 Tax=Prevotella sp. TaxID=59823 RepID=UPI004027DFF5
MRVLYVANSVSLSGGDNKSLLTLLRGVRTKGVEPFVVVPGNTELCCLLKKEGFPVAVVNFRMNVYPNFSTLKDKMLFLPRLFCRRIIECVAVRKISRLCREWKIDVVHSNVSVLTCGLAAARKCRIPHVTHVREFVDLDFALHPYPCMKSFYARLKGADSYVICITLGIQHHHGFEGDHVVQIYNGIAARGCDTAEHTEFLCERYFLYAGRIERAKGVMQLIEAYADFIDCHHDGYSLKLAGGTSDMAYMKELRQYVATRGIESKVQFLGVRSDVGALMKDAQALVVPSVFEAFGRCLSEAMLNGCLTIGHNTGGTKEQYDNGLRECGKEIGLRYTTTAELSACLVRVFLTDAAEFATMRSLAKDVVAKLYAPDVYVDSVCTLYRRILNIENKK